MTPIPTVWWLRPVSKAARVGAQSAVVWKRLYFRPFPASRSAVGVAHGPPNALERGEADVVEQNDEHVRCAGRRPQRLDRRERRLRILGVQGELSLVRPVRDRKHISLDLGWTQLVPPFRTTNCLDLEDCRIWPLAVEQPLGHVRLSRLLG